MVLSGREDSRAALEYWYEMAEVLELSLEAKGMSKKDFAKEIGVSPSRVSDYLTGRAEPTLKIARMICKVLNIPPAVMLGI